MRLERVADGVDRLEAVAGDDEDHALVRPDVAALGQLRERRGGHTTGRLGEDARRLGEQTDTGTDLVVGHRVDTAVGAARQFDGVRAVRRVADGQRLGDGVGLDRPADVMSGGVGLGDR